MYSHAPISRNGNKDTIEVSGSVCYNSITFAETLASTKEQTNFFESFSAETSKALESLDEIEYQEVLDCDKCSNFSFSR